MSQTARITVSRRDRGVVPTWAALFLAALLVVAGAVYTGSQRAEAQTAASNDGVNFGDCSFRNGTGVAETWANQMCWLDVSDMTTPGPKTKKVGDYTISDPQSLTAAVRIQTVGQQVPVEIVRGGQSRTVEIALAQAPTP